MTDYLSNSGSLSPEEAALLHERLWALLEKTSKEYTGGKSSSVSAETAQELLASACFVLNEYLKYTGKTPRDLLSEDIFAAFEHGKKCVLSCCDEARELFKKAYITLPKIPSLSVNETLKSINEGFYHYNIDTFPSRVPCAITYPLMCAVSETELGMEYVCEYLKRLILENYILSRFDAQKVRRLLVRVNPFYSELLINICEIPLQNAIGLAIIGGDIFELKIGGGEREKLVSLFSRASKSEAVSFLETGAQRVCDILELSDENHRNYISGFAKGLLPRIKASAQSGMKGVFI